MLRTSMVKKQKKKPPDAFCICCFFVPLYTDCITAKPLYFFISLNFQYMPYYSFMFDDEVIETSIDKTAEPNGSTTYKLVLAEKEVSKQLGSHLEINDQNGLLSYKHATTQTQTAYAAAFLERFHEFLGWADEKGWFEN